MDYFIERYGQAPDIMLVFPRGYDRDVLPVIVSDNSYRNRQLMGDHDLTLYFSLPGYVDIPIGTTCTYQGEIYTLEEAAKFTKLAVREYEYTLIMYSDQYKLAKYKLRNTVPGDTRLKFSYTAQPQEFLKLIVDNLNQRDEGWSFGASHVVSSERTVSFNHSSCLESLSMVSEAFETEWEVRNKTIYLRKIEYNIESPLALSYGKGNGFKSGIAKSKFGDKNPLEVLYVQGGERNIDFSKYGNKDLLLSKNKRIKFDGTYFNDEEGFVDGESREYMTDAEGYSIRRADKELFTKTEDSLELLEVYPKRVGTITKVDVVNADKNFYDFVDNTIPEDLDYSKHLIDGETMTVIFQTGMLTGKEFDVKYIHKDRRFEIVPQEIDGQTMPNESFSPVIGGEYAIFGMNMPDRYVDDASDEMLREAVRYFYENEVLQVSFMGDMDGIWAKRDWENIGGKIVIGGFINFSDTQFLPEGALIRIVGIVDRVTNPHSPNIELDNKARHTSWQRSASKRIKQEEVLSEVRDKEVVQYTKRRFRNVQETMEMLSESMLDFSEGINPITVHTMQMVIGDESLQFEYKPTVEGQDFDFKPENAMKMFAPAGVLTHKTLGVNFISSADATKKVIDWDIKEFNSATLDDPKKRYYLYARCPQATIGGAKGEFILSETAIKMDADRFNFHLLVGILNSEYEGDREFVPLYGFTEILPGRITTDLIKSADGDTYFDLAKGEIGGKIDFKDGLVSGLIGIGNDKGVNAGMSGVGNAGSDVRIWAGADGENKDSAPFKVLHDGTMFASKAHIMGEVIATTGSFTGSVYATSGEFTGKVTATSGSFIGDVVANNLKANGTYSHAIRTIDISNSGLIIGVFPYSFMRVIPSSNNQQLLIGQGETSNEGKVIYLHNPHDSYNIQLINGDPLTGALGTHTIQPRGTVQLIWSQASSDWIIISYYVTPSAWRA